MSGRRSVCVLAVVLALPAAAGAQPSFVPKADKVFLQRTELRPDLGNSTVILELGSQEVERLKKVTGRTDLITIGPPGAQALFRDDGQEGDERGGDLQFSAIAELNLDELAERGELDTTSADSGETERVPLFSGRSIVGQADVAGFDFDSFDRGAKVQLTRGLAISPSASAPTDSLGVGPIDQVIVPGTNVFQDRVLMIRDPLVVADPTRTWNPCTNVGTQMGPWTFGHLMTEMANQAGSGINPSTFVETWLNHWLNAQLINTFNVPARAARVQALINDWRGASGGGALNLGIAPFRLLSINPRVDLRTTVGSTGGGGYGGAASGMLLDAGEARFTFGLVIPPSFAQSQAAGFLGNPLGGGCIGTRMSTIFEFRVPKCDCLGVRDWARSWIKLFNLVPGSLAYNSHLEGLTRTFTDRNRNPARPNRSAIGQVRTNEIAFANPWEIREYQLRMMPWSFLLETTTADTPKDTAGGAPFNNTVTFGNFVLATLAGATGPAVPLQFPLGSGAAFLGANPQSPNPGLFWNAPNLNVALPAHDQGRHLASLGTCNGCHAGETTTTFVHIDPATPGLPAALSGFLTGIVVPDPAGSGTIREFDDLARRETDIRAASKMICAHLRPLLFSSHPLSALRSDGTEVPIDFAFAPSVPATTDPDGLPMSIAIEDFLREPTQQVH